ncbi:MAG: glycosyltransferase [Caulobacterales bacterium]
MAVGLCTYKRPDGLRRVIRHIGISARSLEQPAHLIVVDNDGADDAIKSIAEEAAAAAGLKLHFIVEPKPGISAARNAIFACAESIGVDLVAMIDDDEWPSEAWLTELLRQREATGAVVVGGPVQPVFPDHKKNLERVARWWSVQPQFLHGRPFVFCTCNFLIDMRAIRDFPRPLFDDSFGLSGGGDTVFFRRLFHADHAMAWAERALVYEDVPESRASLKWMRTRRFRVGNHAVSWEALDHGRLQTLGKTLALTARLGVYPLFGREPEAPFTGWLLEMDKIRGRWDAHTGSLYMEYNRPDAIGHEKACR